MSTNECGCGRSPTGKCIGWHSLSEEDYKKKLAEYEAKNQNQKRLILMFFDFKLTLYLVG